MIPAEKNCPTCEIVKPLNNFYKNKTKKYGHSSICKPCDNERVKSWQAENQDQVKITNRRHRATNQRHIKAVKRKYHEVNRVSILAKQKLYRRSHPEKRNAVNAVSRALMAGNIFRPDSCSQCDKKCLIDAHHWSYEKEHWLDVIWLCRSCHKRLHVDENQVRK